jgi:hypothetical protein
MPFSATEMVCSNSKKPNNLLQYLYFCTSEASKYFVLVSNSRKPIEDGSITALLMLYSGSIQALSRLY